MNNNWLHRTELLIGKENVSKLKNSCVAVFGCGGVGSYAIEGLVRSGIGTLIIIDHDEVDITNINRQLIADKTTVGLSKVEVAKQRAKQINPEINVITYQEFGNISNFTNIIPTDCTYIVDAIDSINSKVELIEYAKNNNIPIISSMGTGNKLNPTMFEVDDIFNTTICPLARIMRKRLREIGIEHLKVVYSKEKPKKFDETKNEITASISFVPSVCGLIISSEVVKDIIS